jgi:hypothetical protein
MFDNLSLLAAVLVDAGLREIPHACFPSSRNLSLVALPDGCAVIGFRAFAACGALAGIDLEHVEVVKVSAFEGCDSLSHVGAHAKVRSIGNSALEAAGVV